MLLNLHTNNFVPNLYVNFSKFVFLRNNGYVFFFTKNYKTNNNLFCFLFFNLKSLKFKIFRRPNYKYITNSNNYPSKIVFSKMLILYKYILENFLITTDIFFKNNIKIFLFPNYNLEYRIFKTCFFLKFRSYRRIKRWLYKKHLKQSVVF